MGADYSFYMKYIATYAPAFLRYNNSVLARVLLHIKNIFVSKNKILVWKSNGLKIVPYVTELVGFQTMVILDS